MLLTKEQILAAKDRKHVDVDVPEWGGTVRVRNLTGKERQAFQKVLPGDGKIPEDMMEHLIVLAACDESGKQLFEKADVRLLSDKSAVALERVFRSAAELNGLTSEAVEKAKGE